MGLSVAGYGAWQLIFSKLAQDEALENAKTIVSEKDVDIPTDFKPKRNDLIGILKIPKINAELPIVEGTDAEELSKGVGHYKDTAFPGQKDQILLSGHRDTVFRNVGKLEIGDELIVEMSYGVFTYVIAETEIVDKNDTSVIHSTAPEEVLTLSTCYPFNLLGSAPERYIIYAPLKEQT